MVVQPVQLLGYVKQAEETGLSVCGFWIQDYSGQITTVFGDRVFWNWCWDPEHYPGKRLFTLTDFKKLIFDVLSPVHT